MSAEPGAAPAPFPRRGGSGLQHLAIAAGAAAVVLGADLVTGRHLLTALDALAGRFSAWFDTRRTPGDSCSPSAPSAYRGVPGIVLDVPACWKDDVTGFLGREVHHFQDPDAKAGTFSVSVEPIAADEDRNVLLAEFEVLSQKPGAIVDGVVKSAAKIAASAVDDETDEPESTGKETRTVTGSLAERVEREGIERGAAAAAAIKKSSGNPAAHWVHRIRTRGEMGATARTAWGGAPNEAAYPRSVWNWLLIGDRSVVRAVYSVRTSWTNDSTVVDEFQLVRSAVDSIRPAQ